MLCSSTKLLITMNVECPFCHLDNAYHNGVCYSCPDCDSEWGGFNFDDEDDFDDGDDFDDDTYE